MTKTKYWLSLLAISVVLVAGSLAVSPIAIAEDDDDDDGDDNERVSVTTQLTNSGDGGVTVLLDTTGSGFLRTVHVAATLPAALAPGAGCVGGDPGPGTPTAGGLVIVAGIAGVTIPSAPIVVISSSGAENTSFPGDAAGTCVYHATVTAPTKGAITDVVVVNGILEGQAAVAFPPGTTVTVTGTYE